MQKRYALLMLLGSLAVMTQISACAPLAAGVAGAAVGHEIGKDDDDDD
jgi:hypothetical protein